MDTLFYISIEQDGDDYVVAVRNVPQIVTSGYTYAEAQELAKNALVCLIQSYMKRGLPLPVAGDAEQGDIAINLPAPLAAKMVIYSAWLDAKISKTELAKRMGRSETEIRRLLDPKYGTKIDQLAEAAKALGGLLTVQFHSAA